MNVETTLCVLCVVGHRSSKTFLVEAVVITRRLKKIFIFRRSERENIFENGLNIAVSLFSSVTLFKI